MGSKNISGGQRAKKIRVKTAKGRRLSSTIWLERQLNDPYVQNAKKYGYRSRAAYKLKEINEKFKIIHPGDLIIDLGAAPGGWTQIALELSKSKKRHGTVIGVDLQEIEPIMNAEFLIGDFTEESLLQELKNLIGERKADCVLSDMAAASCGHPQTDHIRIMDLCEHAYLFAREHLKEGGNFVAKILRGGTEANLLKEIKKDFTAVKHFKPPASRKDSAEMYIIATGFRAG